MRDAEEKKVWKDLKRQRNNGASSVLSLECATIDLSEPCVIVGGRNGVGKTRLLRHIADTAADDCILLDIHSLCAQALTLLRSRDDFSDMAAEFDTVGPTDERRNDVQRVVGREYEVVDWYALEIEPSEHSTAEQFRWGGEEPLLPYFEVSYRGFEYSSREMGLGELSVHLLFWIVEQYRKVDKLILLLDEPDAFLPAIGASGLLKRLLKVCLDRGWSLVIATHSSEIIAQALEEEAFVLLTLDTAGGIVSTHCLTDPTVGDTLLARPPVRYVFFVEDESAWMLTQVLLEHHDRRLANCSSVVWGNGSGYMVSLQDHFPRPPTADIKYAYVFDGDKRKEVQESQPRRWPALFLPTNGDPDDLFKSLAMDVSLLAAKLGVNEGDLSRFIDSREGVDNHDWVNDIGDRYGRQQVLRGFAELWVATNELEVGLFLSDLKRAL